MSSESPRTSSTSDVNGAQFRQHGRVDMHMEDDILVYDVIGPLNVETLDALAIAQMNFLRQLPLVGRRWGSIAVFKVSAVISPASLERYASLMKTPKPPELEAQATAFVFGPDVEGGRIMQPLYRRIYQEIHRPFACFSTLEEAKAWVHAQLAAPPAPAG